MWSADLARCGAFPPVSWWSFSPIDGAPSFRGRPRWRSVCGGSARYVEALVRSFAGRLRLSTPVEAVTRHPDHVVVKPRGGGRSGSTRSSSRPTRIRRCRCSPTRATRARDPRFDPGISSTRRCFTRTRECCLAVRAWASWNYHLLPEPKGMTTVTYHMNRFQRLRADLDFCVTLNRTAAIDPAQVIRTIAYAHPVFTPREARRSPESPRSTAATGPLLRRVLGLGLPRGRRSQRGAGGERFGARS